MVVYMNMLQKLFLIFILIYVTQCEHSFSYSTEDLYTILDETTEYFKNLSNAYNILSTNISNINNEIVKYMADIKTTFRKDKRQKREFQNESSKGVNVLHGFEEILSFHLPIFQDVVFFSMQDEHRLLWFAAAINSSNILLYRVDNKVQLVSTYPQSNNKQIIVNNYNDGTLIVVQTNINEIIILHFGKNEDVKYEMQFKQEFEIPGIVHMNMWLEMNQLYLGIASETKISIYVWLGEYFDKIDTLFYGARKLLPFQNKGFMHIVILGSLTKILRFSVRSNKFVEVQKLHYSNDISSFHFKDGHFEERFLVLAGNESTILYKKLYDRFVPFQKIVPTRYVYSLTMGNTVVFFLLDQDTIKIYQYNGWRFIELRTKLSNIRQFLSIRALEDALLIQDQTGEWKFFRPVWTMKKTWKFLQNETLAWCFETKLKMSQRTPVKLPNSKNPVILNAHIDQLYAQNINDENAEGLIYLTKQYKSTIAKLNLTHNLLVQRIDEDVKRSKYLTLHGKKIRVKCKTNCRVHRIITDSGSESIAKYINSESNQILQFANLKVKTINNWKCPIPNLKFDDIFVKESVNGIPIQDLQEKTLKVSGAQIVSGAHRFTNLDATNVFIPLNIATKSIKQTLRMKEAIVKDLYITDDTFFLSLNAPTEMNGSITAAKVRVTGPIEILGKITGKGIENLKPLKEILTPLIVYDDHFLQNVTFKNFVKTKNILSSYGLSMKEILENIIPLDSNVSAHLILSSDKTQWNNLTLQNSLTKNWVTKNSTETIIISGMKYTNNSVILLDIIFENLPIPKLTIPICTGEVITPEIITSSIKLGDVIVKNLNVSHVLGASNLNTIIFDSVSALHNIDFSTKLFTGQVFIKNISTSEIKGTNLQDLKIKTNEEADVIYIIKSINISQLVVNNLETPACFNISLPTRVKNVIIKGDSNIGKINNIDIQSFIENVLKMDNLISLEHVTFARGFTSNDVYAYRSTLNLSYLDTNLDLGSKEISTSLNADEINVPQTFGYIANDAPATFIIQGSARFLEEPNVQNVKNVNLKQLSENLWMANQDILLTGNNIYFENITLENDIIVLNYNNTLNIEMWLDMKCKFLSKTELQTISMISSFNNVELPNINAESYSILQSSDLDLNNLLTNSLMRDIAQTINATWHFEELYINNMSWNGKFNDINLNTDIVRYDAEQNIIIGKKTILGLTTKNLRSLNINFWDFAKHALTQKCKKFIIKGRKVFDNITLNNLSVRGTISNRNIDDALLKFKNQTLSGIKRIQGQINAPSVIIDGFVNNVNLTQLMNNQIKKYRAMQMIESELEFKNDFEVYGNIIIIGLYEKINLTDINSQNNVNIILNRMTNIITLIESITTALQNRAIYISKFEAVNKDTLQITSSTFNTKTIKYTNLDSTNSTLCESEIISLFCNNTELLNIIVGNISAFITKKLISLNNAEFLVLVSTDFISIYSYVDTEQLDQIAGLYMPNIFEASVEAIDNLLWIFLRLSEETLILRYHAWNELEQYILPGSDSFVISKTPNNESLLIRSDGIWNLGGYFRPEHIFKISLTGQIETFAIGTDYYIKAKTENNTIFLKARYVGN